MRALVLALGAMGALAVGSPASAAQPTPPAQRALSTALTTGLDQAGGHDGAYVVDLTTGQPLYSSAANTPRIPASVEKLYTTSTALLRFGPNATMTTSVYGKGRRGPRGTWVGTLYLRGGGDPTFGSASFDSYNYGTGATIQGLVGNLQRQSGITGLLGRVIGDESYFASLRGTPQYGFGFVPDEEGALSALAYNRGTLAGGTAYVIHPAIYAAQQLVAALRAARLRVSGSTPVSAGKTPSVARLLAGVQSPSIARLIALTNTPSDNFFAEMLLKGIGAKFGRAGTTATGAAVVRSELRSVFGITPTLVDGSGLSYTDSTSPSQVVALLTKMQSNPYFVNSLAVGGETGTLQHQMVGTVAQGRCRGKTGTLRVVAGLAGYCRAANGHTLAFAFLMNSVGNTAYAHAVEANMAVALANYDG